MGIEDETLEMLFIAPEERGKGLGKHLLQFGIENHAVKRLAVNEQNPQQKDFMNISVFKSGKEPIVTNRENHIHLYI